MISPNIISSLGKSATLKIQAGDLLGAEELLNKILALEHNNFHALLLLGSILGSMGRPAESIVLLEKARKINSKDLHVLHNLGKALFDTKAYLAAIPVFKELVSFGGGNLEILMDTGTSYLRSGNPEEAVQYYEHALSIAPESSAAWNNKSAALLELKKIDEAEIASSKALQLDDSNANAWLNRGNILLAKSLFDESIQSFRKSIGLIPDIAKAHIGLANALAKLGRNEAALKQYIQTIEKFPHNADVHYNLGTFYDSIKNYQKSIEEYEKALLIDPSLYIAGWNLSLANHLQGNLQIGWDFYHYRWSLADYPLKKYQNIPPLTDLATGTNMKILVWHEQGLGDSIQFSRFLPMLVNMGYSVTFECQESLVNLFSCIEQISCTTKPLTSSNFDAQVPLLDLPKLFRVNITNIPTPKKYLSSNSAKTLHWKNLVENSTNKLLNIGIANSGNSNHKNDHNRSIPLIEFLPLKNLANLFLLQNHLRDSDHSAFMQLEINHITESIYDFSDTAAIIETLDLVISVDTSIVHLSGALGKKTWLVLPFHNDFRWLRDGESSPWYSNIKIFRQKQEGDWGSVVSDIVNSLSKLRLSA